MIDPIEQIIEGKRKKIRVYPCHVPRASEIGHPCERYLVFSITKWEEKKPHEPYVEFIFEGGRLVEKLAMQDFEDAGFQVYRPEPDRAIAESVPKITGHIDVRLDIGTGAVYTGEIKGLNIFDFDKLNCIEDFHRSKKPWIKKYPAQLMTYLYIKNEEKGFFYLKSIPRFQPKWIWVDLDYDYMESILQKTERIIEHVKNGTTPDVIPYDELTCGYCPFFNTCLPEVKRKALEIITDTELLDKVERFYVLKPSFSEYNKLNKELSERFNEQDKVLLGNFWISGDWVEPKGKAKYWKKKIQKMEVKNG